jgi:hypothetical protein
LQASRDAVDGLIRERETHQSRVRTLERASAEAAAVFAQATQEHAEGRRQWEAEREVLRRQVEEGRQTWLQEMEERGCKEQAQAEAARQEFERERATLRGESEQLYQRVIVLQEEREAALRQVGALRQERDRFAGPRHKEDHFWAELGRRYPLPGLNELQAEAAARDRVTPAKQEQARRGELDQLWRAEAGVNP